MLDVIKNFFKRIYTQLVTMDDSPQRVALGFAVGVFLGILPGTGPVAALAVAWVFQLNKAAALLGSIITNTWLSLATFVLSIKIGCAILGIQWTQVHQQIEDLMHHFTWKGLFDTSVLTILKPLLIGYLIVGFFCGVIGYRVALIFIKKRKKLAG